MAGEPLGSRALLYMWDRDCVMGAPLPRHLPVRPWEAGAWRGIRVEGGVQASVLGPVFTPCVAFPVPCGCANSTCSEVQPFIMCSTLGPSMRGC